jgi:hypothetical protein
VHDLLLPHLAQEARRVRVEAGLSYAHIAVRVLKRDGRRGVSESTIARFETAQHWPENPDAVVIAYADATGVLPCDLWGAATKALCKTARNPIRGVAAGLMG